MDIDGLVIVAVVLSRFLVPLLIPRFPLPAIIASLVLDAVDGTILEKITGSEPEGYQTYDKALDIYYLAIAYVSTMRNWRHLAAFQISRFLFYFRMLGVAAFELSGARWLLIVFPNVFEYFFIWYEALRTRWNPITFALGHVIGAAAVIWVVIKLPQEYWIHIAQLDFTDTMRDYPALWAVIAVGAVVLLFIARRYGRFLGPPDWTTTFAVDTHLDRDPLPETRPVPPIVSWVLFEKVLLVSLLSIIFLQVLKIEASTVELVIALTVVILANSAISHLLTRRGTNFRWLALEFAVMAIFNYAVLLLYIGLRSSFSAEIETGEIFFIVLLFTLILTLYDRYRHMGTALEHGRGLDLARRLRR